MSKPQVLQDIDNLYGMHATARIDIYVATTGNDSTGDGTSAKPYKTINYAKNKLPKNLSGYNAYINIAAGTYTEDVVLSGFSGGIIYLTGVSGASVTIRSLTIYGCVVLHENTYLTVTSKIDIRDRSKFRSYSSSLTVSANATTGTGVLVDYNSEANFNAITLTNCDAGITVRDSSSVNASLITGSGNRYVLYVVSGGRLAYTSNYATGTIVSYTSSGGRIYSGSQTSIPNY